MSRDLLSSECIDQVAETLTTVAVQKFLAAPSDSPVSMKITIGPRENVAVSVTPLTWEEASEEIGDRDFYAISRKTRIRKACNDAKEYVEEHMVKQTQFMPRPNREGFDHGKEHKHVNEKTPCPLQTTMIPTTSCENPVKSLSQSSLSSVATCAVPPPAVAPIGKASLPSISRSSSSNHSVQSLAKSLFSFGSSTSL